MKNLGWVLILLGPLSAPAAVDISGCAAKAASLIQRSAHFGLAYGLDEEFIRSFLSYPGQFETRSRLLELKIEYLNTMRARLWFESHPDFMNALMEHLSHNRPTDRTNVRHRLERIAKETGARLHPFVTESILDCLMSMGDTRKSVSLEMFYNYFDDQILIRLGSWEKKASEIDLFLPVDSDPVTEEVDEKDPINGGRVLLLPEAQEELKALRLKDHQFSKKVQSVLAKANQYGLAGITDHKTLTRSSSKVLLLREIRIHLQPGYRIFFIVDPETEQLIVSSVTLKPTLAEEQTVYDRARTVLIDHLTGAR